VYLAIVIASFFYVINIINSRAAAAADTTATEAK